MQRRNNDMSDNGGRLGYHSPLETDVYLKDRNNPLKRELWRVFQKEDGTAYMIPRPDGLGLTYYLCEDWSPWKEKAMAYGLCNETVTDPTMINNMDPDDALLFANIFHRQLMFEHRDMDTDFPSLAPWVPDEDLLLACAELHAPQEETQDYCIAVEARCNEYGECIELGIAPSVTALEELVPALTDIYGILPDGSPCDPEEWGVSFGCPVAKCPAPPGGCEYVDEYRLNEVRDCCAVLCFATDSLGNECSGASSFMARRWGWWMLLGTLLALRK